MNRNITVILIVMLLAALQAHAQNPLPSTPLHPEEHEVDMDSPTFEPMVKVGKVLRGRDSIQYMEFNNIYVYPQPVFKSAQQRMAYNLSLIHI